MEQTVEIIKYLLTDNALTIVTVTYLFIEAVKHLNLIKSEYLPLIAMFTGLIIGLILGYFNGSDLYETAVLGLISGGFSSGLYKLINPSNKK